MTDASATPLASLIERGVAPHEARWLLDEFTVGDLDTSRALDAAVERRLAHEPIQYILGHWPFRTLDLDVDERVLIPRPETEQLVDVALRELSRHGATAPVIADLGCGSGAIGLALLSELRDRGLAASLLALDISREAIAVAKKNALKHHLMSVTFLQSSWFDELDPSLRGHLDLIVANPPYVAEGEAEALAPELSFEPRGALFSPDEGDVAGFADAATIISEAVGWLRPGGALVLEHGHLQGAASLGVGEAAGYAEVFDLADLAGHARFFVGRRA